MYYTSGCFWHLLGLFEQDPTLHLFLGWLFKKIFMGWGMCEGLREGGGKLRPLKRMCFPRRLCVARSENCCERELLGALITAPPGAWLGRPMRSFFTAIQEASVVWLSEASPATPPSATEEGRGTEEQATHVQTCDSFFGQLLPVFISELTEEIHRGRGDGLLSHPQGQGASG